MKSTIIKNLIMECTMTTGRRIMRKIRMRTSTLFKTHLMAKRSLMQMVTLSKRKKRREKR